MRNFRKAVEAIGEVAKALIGDGTVVAEIDAREKYYRNMLRVQ